MRLSEVKTDALAVVRLEFVRDLAGAVPHNQFFASVREILKDLLLAVEDSALAVVEDVVGCVLQGRVELAGS